MSTDPAGTAAPNVQRLTAELGFLTELAQVVASNTELQPILDWMVQKTTAMLDAHEGSIRLLGPESTPSLKTLVRKETPGNTSGSWPPAIGMNVMGFLMVKGEPLATPDLVADDRFPGLKNVETRIRAVLAVPLRVDNRFTGMLAVTQATPGRQWTKDEIQLLSIVASSSAGAIEQARLRAEAFEKQRLEEAMRRQERELGVARDIQMSLVPSGMMRFGPWEACGRVVPARQVGGDAFDFFALSEGRFAVAIADVAGKGVPAALLMSNFQASLRAFCDGRHSIAQALAHVNQGVSRTIASGKFITAFYAEADPAHGVLRFGNAGHNYPLLRRADGTISELAEGGLPLGIVADAVYEAHETPFVPGDSLLLYSDGISEALDARRQQFGEDRLQASWRACADRSPAEVIAHILADVERFRGAAEPSDDMTLVIVSAARPAEDPASPPA